MSNIAKLPDHREADAAARFGSYVQSIAFNLTLSRQMIETLRIIRDFGWPLNMTPEQNRYGLEQLRAINGNRNTDLATPFRALERRGLAYHAPSPSDIEFRKMSDAERAKWNGHRHYRLTRPGELVCELLVEAGLMPAAVPAKRKRA